MQAIQIRGITLLPTSGDPHADTLMAEDADPSALQMRYSSRLKIN